MSQIEAASIREYTDIYLLVEKQLQNVEEGQFAWKPSPEEWSIAEVLGHLVDASIVHYYRVRKVLAEPNNRIWPIYAQNEWVAESRATDASPAHSLDVFRRLARYNGEFFERLEPEAWNRTALNDKGEEVSVRGLFDHYLSHTGIHIRQIERIKSQWNARAKPEEEA